MLVRLDGLDDSSTKDVYRLKVPPSETRPVMLVRLGCLTIEYEPYDFTA